MGCRCMACCSCSWKQQHHRDCIWSKCTGRPCTSCLLAQIENVRLMPPAASTPVQVHRILVGACLLTHLTNLMPCLLPCHCSFMLVRLQTWLEAHGAPGPTRITAAANPRNLAALRDSGQLQLLEACRVQVWPVITRAQSLSFCLDRLSVFIYLGPQISPIRVVCARLSHACSSHACSRSPTAPWTQRAPLLLWSCGAVDWLSLNAGAACSPGA